jgi:hypothetical protein
MGVRETTTQEPRGRVVHGPFRVRLGALTFGVVSLLFAPLLFALALDDARLACDSTIDRCRYDGSLIGDRSETFPLSQLEGVRVEVELGSKGARHGVPYLDVSGRRLRLASVSVDEARRFARELDHDRAAKLARFQLDLAAERGIALPGVMFLALGVTALVAALRGTGRLVIVVRGAALHVARSVFGILASSVVVDTAGVTDVDIAWEHKKTFFTQRYSAGETHGRLVLVRGDAREPLTETPFPGHRVHLRAARELREVLGLQVRSPEREAEFAAAARWWAPKPLMGGGMGAVIALAWIGICCGALLAIPLSWIALRSLGLAGRDPPDAVFGVGVSIGAMLGVATAFYLRRRAETR